MTISMIAALSENRVIGRNNAMPWNLPDDMKYFKRITTTEAVNNHVIMGRKNWDSIPPRFRPLAGRINWILTRHVEAFHASNPYVLKDSYVHDSLDEIFDQIVVANTTTGYEEIFIIGGGEVYTLALPFAQKLYLTEIKAQVDGDVYFPKINMDEWEEISREHHGIDEKHKHEFDFVVYNKK